MTMNRVRFGLLAIFGVGLSIQLVAFLAVSSKMWPEDFQGLIVKLLGLYSVHFGVILGGMFAQPKGPLEDPPAPLAWSAIFLATLWNSLLVWRSLNFSAAAQDSATDVTKYMDAVSSAGSFLVAGMLAFFFTKGTTNVRSKELRSRGGKAGVQAK
jgi:hypothetical protein